MICVTVLCYLLTRLLLSLWHVLCFIYHRIFLSLWRILRSLYDVFCGTCMNRLTKSLWCLICMTHLVPFLMTILCWLHISFYHICWYFLCLTILIFVCEFLLSDNTGTEHRGSRMNQIKKTFYRSQQFFFILHPHASLKFRCLIHRSWWTCQ